MMMDNQYSVFDAHFHIIDSQYPLSPTDEYRPSEFTCTDYLDRVEGLGVAGGAVVSGSFQGFDQSYLLTALEQLGSSYVGVTQLPRTVADEEILRLNAAGVRAIRFNLERGGSEDVRYLDSFSRRVFELADWHTELYVDSRALPDLFDTLASLPSVCIDHLGLSGDGFGTLLELVRRGVHVKATGFGRIDFDAGSALRAIYAANPDSLLFGTDLPSTRAPRPFEDTDMALVIETLGSRAARKVLWENAIRFYGLKRSD